MRKKLLGGLVHELPADLGNALAETKETTSLWQSLTPIARNEFICWVEDAKQEKTRARRIARAVEELLEGQKRPCCWAGCIHRTDKTRAIRHFFRMAGALQTRRSRPSRQPGKPSPVADSTPSTCYLLNMFTRAALRAFIAAAAISGAGLAHAQEALTCNMGSLERTFGGTSWIVHGCDDGKSLVVVSAAENPASPFYFVLLWNGSVPDHGYRVSGEGTGNREASAAAFAELRAFTRQQIEALSAEAQSATN